MNSLQLSSTRASLVAQMVKNLTAMQQETWVRPLGKEGPLNTGSPLQYSCLGNPRARGACWTALQGITKSQTWPRDFYLTLQLIIPRLTKVTYLKSHSISICLHIMGSNNRPQQQALIWWQIERKSSSKQSVENR